MASIATIVTGRAKAGKRDELYRLFEQQLKPRAERNGAQQAVVWIADELDPQTFHLFEIYRDRESMDANARAEWFGAYMAQAGPLLDGQPQMRMGSVRWANSAT